MSFENEAAIFGNVAHNAKKVAGLHSLKEDPVPGGSCSRAYYTRKTFNQARPYPLVAAAAAAAAIPYTGAYPGCSEGGGGAERRRGGRANKPNKRATELKPRTCAHQGSMFRPY